MNTEAKRAAGRAACAAAGLVCDELVPARPPLSNDELDQIADLVVKKLSKSRLRHQGPDQRPARPSSDMPILSAADQRIAAKITADVMAERQGAALTGDQRAAFDRASRQIAGMQPGQSRAPVTLQAAYAASDALGSALGRIYRG